MVKGCQVAKEAWGEKERKREEMEIAYMKAQGLYVDHTKADGNCFFRAISMALHGSEDRHTEVRQLVCDHMAANSATLSFFCSSAEETQRRARPSRRRSTRSGASASASSSSSPIPELPTECERELVFQKHVQRMRKDGEWADSLELLALTSAYQRRLGVFVFARDGDSEPRLQMIGEEFFDEILYVAFREGGAHYETVRNIGGPHHGRPECHPIVETGEQNQGEAERAITEDGVDKEDSKAAEADPSAKRGHKRRLSDREEDDSKTEVPLAAKKSRLSDDTAPASVLTEEAPTAGGEKAAIKPAASPEARSATPAPTKQVENAGIPEPVEEPAPSQQINSASSAGQKRKFSQRGADGEGQGHEDARPKKAPKPAPRKRDVPHDHQGAALFKQRRLGGRVLDHKAASARQPDCSATEKSAEPATPVPAGKVDAPKAAVTKPKDAIHKTATGRVEKIAASKTACKKSSPVGSASTPRRRSADTDRLPASTKRLPRELKVNSPTHHEKQPKRQVESEKRSRVRKLELAREEKRRGKEEAETEAEGVGRRPVERADDRGRASAIDSGKAARRHSI